MEQSAKKRKLSSSPHTSDVKVVDQEDFSDNTNGGKGNQKRDGESSPARCPICLDPLENRAKSESCSHYFCFGCLKEWSKVKAECPLCKMPIQTIFHSIKSDLEFEEYRVKLPGMEMRPNSSFPHPEIFASPNSFESWWRFRVREFRAQVQRRRENELAAREASSNILAIRARRTYYWNKTKVNYVDTRSRVRDVSAKFFRQNPSQLHRLEPWLKRELTVLYGVHNRALISTVRDQIMAAAIGIGITSPAFVNLLQPYLLEHTDQFVHEFLSFAKSPYDIHQYDRHARYSAQESVRSHRGARRSRDPFARNRSLMHRRHRSRWDESPDSRENPGEPSSQSVMLSQTSWGDDPTSMYPIVPVESVHMAGGEPHSSRLPVPSDPVNVFTSGNFSPAQDSFISSGALSNHSYHYAGLFPPRRFEMPSDRDVEAPLVHQTLDAHRTLGSSARQYGRMEIMRQHFDQHTKRRRAEARRHKERYQAMPVVRIPQEVIVISSDSSDNEEGLSSASYSGESKAVLHYKPVASRKGKERISEDTKIKMEKSEESSCNNSSESQTESDDNDIEFVKYIKPPHLRTPDVYIELSSTDDDAPGPSTRISSAAKLTSGSSSASSPSSSSDSSSSSERMHRHNHRGRASSVSMGKSDPTDILQRTKEFLRKAKEVSKSRFDSSEDNKEGNADDTSVPQVVTESIDVLGTPTVAGSEGVDICNTSRPVETVSHETYKPSDEKRFAEAELPSLPDATPSQAPKEVTNDSGSTCYSFTSQNSAPSEQPATSNSKSSDFPKKVFERGKISVDLVESKRNNYYDSESDSDIDVGVEEVRPSQPYSWRPFTMQGSPPRGLLARDEVDTAQSLHVMSHEEHVSLMDVQERHIPRSRPSSPHRSTSRVTNNQHRRSSDRSRHKRKRKKHRHTNRHEIRRHGSTEFDDFYEISRLSRCKSSENAEFARRPHYSSEKNGRKHHKSHKKKSSKHHRRSRSSSVEFVSRIHRS